MQIRLEEPWVHSLCCLIWALQLPHILSTVWVCAPLGATKHWLWFTVRCVYPSVPSWEYARHSSDRITKPGLKREVKEVIKMKTIVNHSLDILLDYWYECGRISLLDFNKKWMSSDSLHTTKNPMSAPATFLCCPKFWLVNLYFNTRATNLHRVSSKVFGTNIPDKIVPVDGCWLWNLEKGKQKTMGYIWYNIHHGMVPFWFTDSYRTCNSSLICFMGVLVDRKCIKRRIFSNFMMGFSKMTLSWETLLSDILFLGNESISLQCAWLY